MVHITGPRGTGRTTHLIARFLEDPEGLLCVPHAQHKTRAWDCIRKNFAVRNEAITPEVERDLQQRILSAGEFAECRPAPRGRVYIDDAELVLSFFLRNQVKAAVFLSRELP